MLETYFHVTNGKVHKLVDGKDLDRFPLGRAKCAPFPRYSIDITSHSVKDFKNSDMCKLCL